MSVTDILRLGPVMPVLVIDAVEHAVPLARALVAGGVRVLEVTLRTPVAFDAVRAIRAAVPDALRGYKEIHIRALKLLKPGGVLATFCCSHHVTTELFQDVILAAAYDARKLLRRVATYGQSPDHPVIPAIPETEYLKGFAFEICP